ncbi:DUF2271 domain-containing protein [Mariniflexile litorale]|uniref:DUF2271 domain-containing protein n=1 Tax=Mariniflexile litorale TaxID=3045158 RepID=A0AAU7EBI7_9FLAO|nr:DUF2271 domain-containing protein [Mariniflexile sp. KMM 9835]MDQ8212507.1 DUF2271 domain-containing protein [Mariniflexile sp. KMM 9835]
MKFSKYILCVVCLSFMAFTTIKNSEPTQKYKCMVQLKNYQGEGAYVIVSVVDKNNKYIKTLQILGDDEKWYPDLPKWWSFFETAKETDVDAITGATIAGGERSIFTFQLSEKYLKAGNKLRFETAVEHQDYYEKDLEISLENKNLKNKFIGTGYIRYVSIITN